MKKSKEKSAFGGGRELYTQDMGTKQKHPGERKHQGVIKFIKNLVTQIICEPLFSSFSLDITVYQQY